MLENSFFFRRKFALAEAARALLSFPWTSANIDKVQIPRVLRWRFLFTEKKLKFSKSFKNPLNSIKLWSSVAFPGKSFAKYRGIDPGNASSFFARTPLPFYAGVNSIGKQQSVQLSPAEIDSQFPVQICSISSSSRCSCCCPWESRNMVPHISMRTTRTIFPVKFEGWHGEVKGWAKEDVGFKLSCARIC